MIPILLGSRTKPEAKVIYDDKNQKVVFSVVCGWGELLNLQGHFLEYWKYFISSQNGTFSLCILLYVSYTSIKNITAGKNVLGQLKNQMEGIINQDKFHKNLRT